MSPNPQPPPGFDGHYVESWPMADEMSLSMIRLWCEVLEDANPLYHDEAYARGSRHGGIIVPPSMIMPLFSRPEWTPEGTVVGTAGGLASSMPEYPNSASLGIYQNYHRPLRPGDRPMIHAFQTEMSPEKMTERGPGRVSIRYQSMHDPDGNEIASHSIETLRFRAPEGGPAAAAPAGAAAPAVPPGETLRRRRPEDPPLYWDDVQEGESLPPLYMPLTLKLCIKWVAATRDYYEVHHDTEFARGVGAPDLFIGVHFFHGMAGRYATDWAGPNGDLRRFEIHSLGRAHPGDVVEIAGRVARKFREADEGRVDLALDCGNARGKTHSATVTVALPDR